MAVTQDGQRYLEKLPWESQRNVSEELSRIADEECARLVSDAYERAKRVLVEHADALRAVAAELKRAEVLDGDALRHLVARVEQAPASTHQSSVERERLS
jgi:cell division protease FtsH